MVIVILGILAAFALPRFADLGADARKSTIQGAAGSIKSAAAIAHSKWLAEGTKPSSVKLENLDIAMVNGYPQALASRTTGILAAAQVYAAATTDSNRDFDLVGTGGANAGDSITVKSKDLPTGGKCEITYTAPADGSAPVVTVDVSKC